MRDEILNLILGTVNIGWGTAVTSHSPTVAPVIDKVSFEDMLGEEANFMPSHQPRYVKFADTVGGLTSTPHNFHKEVAFPPRPTFQSNPEEIGLHTAAQEFQEMWELRVVNWRVVTPHQLGWSFSLGWRTSMPMSKIEGCSRERPYNWWRISPLNVPSSSV